MAAAGRLVRRLPGRVDTHDGEGQPRVLAHGGRWRAGSRQPMACRIKAADPRRLARWRQRRETRATLDDGQARVAASCAGGEVVARRQASEKRQRLEGEIIDLISL
jgi:hypothetical protein